MADTFVERLTGQATAEAVSAEIGLVMTDGALFDGDEEAADLTGYGPIPAATARDIARQHTTNSQHTNSQHTGRQHTGGSRQRQDTSNHQGGDKRQRNHDNGNGSRNGDSRIGHRVAGSTGDARGDVGRREERRAFLRRLFTDPVTGIIVDCDARRRRFDGVLAKLLVYRDAGTCRMPYCDAPIRHLDHIRSHAAGGPTTSVNGEGLCARCNYIKEMTGFTVQVIDEARHIIEITTPTGHTYFSSPPPTPGTPLPGTPSPGTSKNRRRSTTSDNDSDGDIDEGYQRAA